MTTQISNAITICPLLWGSWAEYNFRNPLPATFPSDAVTQDMTYIDQVCLISIQTLTEGWPWLLKEKADILPGPVLIRDIAPRIHALSRKQ